MSTSNCSNSHSTGKGSHHIKTFYGKSPKHTNTPLSRCKKSVVTALRPWQWNYETHCSFLTWDRLNNLPNALVHQHIQNKHILNKKLMANKKTADGQTSTQIFTDCQIVRQHCIHCIASTSEWVTGLNRPISLWLVTFWDVFAAWRWQLCGSVWVH